MNAGEHGASLTCGGCLLVALIPIAFWWPTLAATLFGVGILLVLLTAGQNLTQRQAGAVEALRNLANSMNVATEPAAPLPPKEVPSPVPHKIKLLDDQVRSAALRMCASLPNCRLIDGSQIPDLIRGKITV